MDLDERLISRVRCPEDGGDLRAEPGGGAAVRCSTCGRTHSVEGGVLRLMPITLHEESNHERGVRDREAPRFQWDAMEEADDFMAVGATMDALAAESDHDVLEMGAGTGRFTRLLLDRCRSVVALDISGGALEVLAAQAPPTTPLLLVQADAATPVPAPGQFDRVLGTLVSNLPDDESLRSFLRVAARALRPDGRLVFTAHHYGLRARLDGEERTGRYASNAIFRRLFTSRELASELRPYFRVVRIRPVAVRLPFSLRLGAAGRTLNATAERIPGLRAFGQLLLVDARGPLGP